MSELNEAINHFRSLDEVLNPGHRIKKAISRVADTLGGDLPQRTLRRKKELRRDRNERRQERKSRERVDKEVMSGYRAPSDADKARNKAAADAAAAKKAEKAERRAEGKRIADARAAKKAARRAQMGPGKKKKGGGMTKADCGGKQPVFGNCPK